MTGKRRNFALWRLGKLALGLWLIGLPFAVIAAWLAPELVHIFPLYVLAPWVGCAAVVLVCAGGWLMYSAWTGRKR